MKPSRSALLLSLLLIGAPALGQDTAVLERRLQQHLDSLRSGGIFPGATLGIALADGRTIALAVGGVPMQPRDRMLAGSVGKTFVAAVALQLVAEGRLDLDAPIARHLGDRPWFDRLPNAAAITVRQLLNHTSGLLRYEFDPRVHEIITREPDHVWTPEERVSFLLDTEAPFPAGEGWAYSDTNYIVLGMIIEAITRADLNDEIRRRVTAPLGLPNTIPSDRRRLPGVVQGYAGPQNPFGGRDAMIQDGVLIMNPQMEWAGGGYASTAEDLAKWVKLLFEGRAFAAGLLPTLLDGVPVRPGADVRYGLGAFIRSTPHGPGYGHSGFFPGYISEMRYYPDLSIAVALQFNTSVGQAHGANPSAMLDALAGIVVLEILGPAARARS
jgi:D-alanyl-D-alanine carboxypeptidase